MQYLENKQFEEAYFGWFGAKDFFSKYAGVIKVDYIDTTSSAGDWFGYILIKDKSKKRPYKLIEFYQENRYPYIGYRVATSLVKMAYPSMPSEKEIFDSIELFNN